MKVIGSVVVITVILLLGLIGLLFNRPSALDAPSSFYVLEAYYLARGSWEGVDILAEKIGSDSQNDDEWEHLVLLDQDNLVLLDQGRSDRIGQLYAPTGNEISYPYQVNGQQVGTLVLEAWLSEPGFLGPLPEVVGISFLTVLLTLLIGLLLMRRIVTPLANMMAAAQQVTAGDLSARVEVSGPDDFRTLTDSFNRMVATLEKNSQERRRLLADIAHELRTPLSIQRGRLEGMLDGIYALSEAQIDC
jgi:two-component system OmpR family sensor kinase/two-component system sensor histidine kinase BaeS